MIFITVHGLRAWYNLDAPVKWVEHVDDKGEGTVANVPEQRSFNH